MDGEITECQFDCGCAAVNVEVRTDSVMVVSSKFAGLELSAQEFGCTIQLFIVDRYV